MPPPIFPDNPPEILTKGDDTPAGQTVKPSMVPDSGGPIQSSAPEPLLPSPDSLSVEIGTPMPDGHAEMSPTEKAQIALHRVDEAKRPIDRKNTWKGAVKRIKWVMDTLSPIAEVRAISFLLRVDRAEFRPQLHPFAKMAYGMVSAIPEVHMFALLSEGNTYAMSICVPDTPRAV